MNNATIKSRIKAVLNKETNIAEAIELVESLHPSVAHEALSEFSSEETLEILQMLSLEIKVTIFSYFSLIEQCDLIRLMDEKESVSIIHELPDDERTDLLRSINPELHDRLLFLLEEEEREEVILLESYPEGSVGSIMTTAFVKLNQEVTAEEAIEEIRKQEIDAETIYYLYICDSTDNLIGVTTLRQIVMASPTTPLKNIIQLQLITVSVLDTKWSAVMALRKSDLMYLPVLDSRGKIVGIVTHDDLEDAAMEEVTDDFHRMAGAPGLKAMSLKDATVPQMLIKRLPWLLILVFMNVFSGAGIAHFEKTIEAMVSLVFFLPLLIDSGGNAGSQAATLMVRSLALGDVKMKDWLGLFGKELLISLCMGIGMGLAVSAVAYFRAPEIIPVVAITMVLTVMVGSLTGMLLPFIFTKLKLDAATASAPLITSIADICGVLIYFGIATAFLGL